MELKLYTPVKRILQILISFFVLILLDILWFTFMGSTYDAALEPLANSFNQDLPPYLVFASTLIYLFMSIALVFYILPKVEADMDYIFSFLYGGVLGLCIYGVYEFTNYLLFNGWPLRIAVLDTCFGFLLFGLTTILMKFLSSFVKTRL